MRRQLPLKRYFAILIDLKRRGHTSRTTASHVRQHWGFRWQRK